jgi:hypothetical protein
VKRFEVLALLCLSRERAASGSIRAWNRLLSQE